MSGGIFPGVFVRGYLSGVFDSLILQQSLIVHMAIVPIRTYARVWCMFMDFTEVCLTCVLIL